MKPITLPAAGLGVSFLLGLALAAGPPAAAQQPGGKPRPPTTEQAVPPESKPAAAPESKEVPSRKSVVSLPVTIKLALMADPRLLLPYDIEVTVDGSKAVLSGEVASQEETRAAMAVAQQVEGVKAVVSKLKVVPELARALARNRDETITKYVKARFKASTTLEAAAFEVKTEDGVVSLSGQTRFQVIVLEAAEAARQVPGVKAVRTEGVRLEAGD
ncbi:BON domain-containing protein [Nitrospira sp. Kam-Ns4a]